MPCSLTIFECLFCLFWVLDVLSLLFISICLVFVSFVMSCMVLMPLFMCWNHYKTSQRFLTLVDLHEIKLDLTILLPLVHALFSFSVSSVSDISGVSIMFGLIAWNGRLLKEFSIKAFGSHVPYCLSNELRFI